MKFLINASNLRAGGGLQVADSICRELYKFSQHEFVVVLSSFFYATKKALEGVPNVKVIEYNIQNTIPVLILGRDRFLDDLIDNNEIQAVLTVFGPSRWNPRVPHLSGFAISQILIPESPYFEVLGLKDTIKFKIYNSLLKIFFERSGKFFYTENPYISERLIKAFPNVSVYTVTNYYNQIFDLPEQWREYKLPPFRGTTLLTIATPYIHKNVTIAAETARILKRRHPDFMFRFAFSFEKKDYHVDISDIEDCFLFLGRVDIAECPSLYQQCDIVFTPTLIECFTAAYPEAMRMGKPILTTDLEFAHGLCGEAAEYYSPLDAKECADAIYKLATNSEMKEKLVRKGNAQLNNYDSYVKRAAKLICILENITINEQ